MFKTIKQVRISASYHQFIVPQAWESQGGRSVWDICDGWEPQKVSQEVLEWWANQVKHIRMFYASWVLCCVQTGLNTNQFTWLPRQSSAMKNENNVCAFSKVFICSKKCEITSINASGSKERTHIKARENYSFFAEVRFGLSGTIGFSVGGWRSNPQRNGNCIHGRIRTSLVHQAGALSQLYNLRSK